MTLALAIVLISILISSLTALAVWLNNSRRREDVLYIVTSVSYVLLGLTNYLSTITYESAKLILARSVMAASAASIVLTYALVQRLLYADAQDSSRYRLFRYPLLFGFVAAAFSPLVIEGFDNSGGGEKLVFGIGMAGFGAYLGFYVFLAVFKLIRYIGSGRDEQNKAQARLLLIGFLPVLVLAPITSMFLPSVYGDLRFISLTPIYSAFFVIMVGYAMVRHKLFGIRSFVVTATAYSVTTLLLATVYVLPTLFLLSQIWGIELDVLHTSMALVLLLFIATNYNRIQLLFNRLTNRIFFRDSYDPTELIRQLNKVCVSSIDLEKLIKDSTRLIRSELRAEYACVILSETNLQPVRIIGSTPNTGSIDPDTVMASSHLIDGEVKVQGLLSERDSKLKTEMLEQGIALIAPLFIKQSNRREMLGYLVVGHRKSGMAYDNRDVVVIEAITSTLVIAMQNALHFEEIQQFNATLQAKVEEATRKYRMANEKLKKLDETKDEFISMASHQLRTPLTSVKGYLSMVLEGDAGKLNPTQEDLLKQSFLSSERMVNLIADLLNLSRLNTGKFVIDSVPTDLRTVVEGELAQLKETAKAKNIELVYSAPPAFPLLMLDENKIHQVVMNFIDNAIYYTQQGGRIEVSLLETPTSVEYRVKDNGIGVPRQLQRHLFSKFYRADNARRMRPDGTGLGLFMAKKVIIAQGGVVIFESVEGQGSTFGFRFNKGRAAVPAQAPAPAATAA